MTRFKKGDRVRILKTVATPFAGLEGYVSEFQPHGKVPTLDRYSVTFAWGEQATFYDVQLELVSAQSAHE